MAHPAPITVCWIVLLGALVGTGALARAETLKVLTKEFPPYNYSDNTQITSLSTEVVRLKADGTVRCIMERRP